MVRVESPQKELERILNKEKEMQLIKEVSPTELEEAKAEQYSE